MKKSSLMITIILAILGCLLIGLSVYFFLNGNENIKANKTKSELEEARRKLELLNYELEQKKVLENNAEKKNGKDEHFKLMFGKNIPVVEITDIDLAKDESGDKEVQKTYRHQIRFYLFNVGKSSLKDVIFSIKDIYNDPKEIKKKSHVIGHNDDNHSKGREIGTYENFEIGTLTLKSRRLIYATTMRPSSGVSDYTFDVIVEWKGGFYQMHVRIDEVDGKLKYSYDYFDIDGKTLDLPTLEKAINN